MKTILTTQNEELKELVERLVGQNWREVAKAERVLIYAGDAGLQAVTEGMTHPNSQVRRACAGFMDHHGDDRCLLGLTERLLNDPVPNVRREAVHSLGCDRCKAMPLSADRVPLLMSVIENDPNKWVCYEAIWALNTGKDDPRYFPLLRRILETETDKDIRKVAHSVLYHRDPTYKAEHILKIKDKERHRVQADAPQKAGFE